MITRVPPPDGNPAELVYWLRTMDFAFANVDDAVEAALAKRDIQPEQREQAFRETLRDYAAKLLHASVLQIIERAAEAGRQQMQRIETVKGAVPSRTVVTWQAEFPIEERAEQ
ncbi:MAG: hypothetical protein IT541_16105 [Hyphomicrobiales bacterium]|nr:hypothetical protein [Hyphomicrobiales bacterium]